MGTATRREAARSHRAFFGTTSTHGMREQNSNVGTMEVRETRILLFCNLAYGEACGSRLRRALLSELDRVRCLSELQYAASFRTQLEPTGFTDELPRGAQSKERNLPTVRSRRSCRHFPASQSGRPRHREGGSSHRERGSRGIHSDGRCCE